MGWKRKKMQWLFPSTGGGHQQGYNSSSQAHFDRPMDNLIRETLQNSLDAVAPDHKVVRVDIYEKNITPSDINGKDLAKHIKKSLEFIKHKRQERGIVEFENALEILGGESIPVLAIVDSNTTGLTDTKWQSLVFTDGTTDKSGIDAPGGSYGIGKNASYIMSDLDTICYSTHYDKDGKTHDQFTACAKLTTHKNPDGGGDYLQDVGYGTEKLTKENGPIPLTGKDIPRQDVFRLNEPGTGIFVMGAKRHMHGWKNKATHTILKNFFAAIRDGKLEVKIATKIINTKNIEEELESTQNKKAYYYYHALKDPDVTETFTNELGNFEVCFRKWDQSFKAPNSAAYVNRRGMLITNDKTRKNNPFFIKGFENLNYAMVIRAKDDGTDKRIRKMEPPDHKRLQLSRIIDKAQFEQYNNNLNSLRDKMKKFMNKLYGRGNETFTTLDELDMFADVTNSGNSSTSTQGGDVLPDNLFWKQVEPSYRPPSRRTEPGTYQPGSTSGSDKSKDRDPPKPQPPRDPSSKSKKVASRFQNLRIKRDDNVLRIAFSTDSDSPIRFEIQRVGEEPMIDPVIPVTSCKVISPDSGYGDVDVSDNVISINSPAKDTRTMLEIPVTGNPTAYDLKEIVTRNKPEQKSEVNA